MDDDKNVQICKAHQALSDAKPTTIKKYKKVIEEWFGDWDQDWDKRWISRFFNFIFDFKHWGTRWRKKYEKKILRFNYISKNIDRLIEIE